MTPTKLRHRVEDDDVIISGVREGVSTTTIKVGSGEAKRFGWSLLADLDPDEADAVALEQSEQRKAAMKARILLLLSLTPCRIPQIAAVIGATKDQVSGIIMPLRKCQWIVRVDGGSGRDPATFGLTDAGRLANGFSCRPDRGRRTAA